MIVIAHRGAHEGSDKEAIENTEGAICAALEAFPPGAPRAIEVDLRPSRDGHPFLFHDDAIDRLVPGGGKTRFSSLLADAIERLRLLRGARVLSLEKLFEISPRAVTLHLEFKDPDPGWIAKWEGIWRAEPNVVCSSFHPEVTKEAARRGHKVHWLTRSPTPAVLAEAKTIGAAGIDLSVERAEAAGAALADSGVPAFLYVVDDADRLRRARACGAAGVFSDDPRALFRELREK